MASFARPGGHDCAQCGRHFNGEPWVETGGAVVGLYCSGSCRAKGPRESGIMLELRASAQEKLGETHMLVAIADFRALYLEFEGLKSFRSAALKEAALLRQEIADLRIEVDVLRVYRRVTDRAEIEGLRKVVEAATVVDAFAWDPETRAAVVWDVDRADEEALRDLHAALAALSGRKENP
jgi:hypothetical protein